ncbi:MAG: hypothetical protein ACOC41_02810 [Chitinivibrionales bacterium]
MLRSYSTIAASITFVTFVNVLENFTGRLLESDKPIGNFPKAQTHAAAGNGGSHAVTL